MYLEIFWKFGLVLRVSMLDVFGNSENVQEVESGLKESILDVFGNYDNIQEVESGLKGLMLDVFGNYVVQKLLEFGTDEIKQEIQAKVN